MATATASKTPNYLVMQQDALNKAAALKADWEAQKVAKAKATTAPNPSSGMYAQPAKTATVTPQGPATKAQAPIPSQGTTKTPAISASQTSSANTLQSPITPMYKPNTPPAQWSYTKTTTPATTYAYPPTAGWYDSTPSPATTKAPTQAANLQSSLAQAPKVQPVPAPPKVIQSNDPMAIAGEQLMRWFSQTPGYLEAQIRSQQRHQTNVSQQPYEQLPGYQSPGFMGVLADTLANIGAISRNTQRLPGIGKAFETIGDYGGDALDFWLNTPANAVITTPLPTGNSAGEYLSAAFDTIMHPPMANFDRVGLNLLPGMQPSTPEQRAALMAYQKAQQLAQKYPTVATSYRAPTAPMPQAQAPQMAMAQAPTPPPISTVQWALQQAQRYGQAYVPSYPQADTQAYYGGSIPTNPAQDYHWTMPQVAQYQRRQWDRPQHHGFQNPIDQQRIADIINRLRGVG